MTHDIVSGVAFASGIMAMTFWFAAWLLGDNPRTGHWSRVLALALVASVVVSLLLWGHA